MSPIASRGRRAHLSLAGLAAVLAVSLVPAAASAAPPPVRFEPVIGACNPRGTATPNLRFRLTVRSKAGALKLDRQVTTNGSGAWAAPCGQDIAIGDVFTAKRNGTTIRSFTVPRIGLTIDRDADVLAGTAPKAQTVSIVVRSCQAQSMGCTLAAEDERDVTADGLWDWPLDGIVDLRGTDDVTVTWNGAKGDRVESIFYPPMLRAQRGSAGVFVTGLKPGATAKVTLVRNSTTAATVTMTASRYGYASGDLRRNGTKVSVKVGDVVRLNGVAGVEVPVVATSAVFGIAGATATGTCYPNGTGAISMLSTSGDTPFTTTGDGSFSIDLVTSVDAGDQVLLICATAAGDTLWRIATVP